MTRPLMYELTLSEFCRLDDATREELQGELLAFWAREPEGRSSGLTGLGDEANFESEE